ncbi:hypothetical protein HC891_27045, partial [Candidatus Gracilibacteria bacterium]|nr:hypothetical protein [Candidatus Gracilibacteria bacterium]
ANLTETLDRVQPYFRPLALKAAVTADRPVLLSEFGGLSYAPRNGERWHGYGTVDSPTALLNQYRDLVSAVLASPRLAGFCYTQLTDVAQETNGLLDAARRPKLDTAMVAAINRQPAHAVPGEVLSSIHQQAAALLAVDHDDRAPSAPTCATNPLNNGS